MHVSGSSIPRFFLLAGFLGLASCAGGGGGGGAAGGSSSPQMHDPQSMQGMNMEQMMEHCRQMQGMDRSQMGPDMQQMMQQCETMMRSHGGGAAPGTSSP